MFKTERNLLLFTPYHFSNGTDPKKKFFIVLKNISGESIVASLPTSQDKIPSDMTDSEASGCVNNDARMVNCFIIKAGQKLSSTESFTFRKDTFIYGETVDIVNISTLEEQYPNHPKDYSVVCKVDNNLYQMIIECLLTSKSVKRKVKRALLV